MFNIVIKSITTFFRDKMRIRGIEEGYSVCRIIDYENQAATFSG
jgi:hypothetical protein